MKPLFAILFITLLVSPAAAGLKSPGSPPCVPDPFRSNMEVHGMDLCQYRFNAHGGLDELSVEVTLRDAFDNPMADAGLIVRVDPSPGSVLCACCDHRVVTTTAADGTARVGFSRLGGRGFLDVTVSTVIWNCLDYFSMERTDLPFTTPDQNASCEAEPDYSMDVIDIGLWSAAYGGGPYLRTSDFDCNGTVDVIDVGLFLSGYLRGCTCE